jgi:hypothetical protein
VEVEVEDPNNPNGEEEVVVADSNGEAEDPNGKLVGGG